MKIEDKAVEDFRRGYAAAFNEELTLEAARERLRELLELFETLRRPASSAPVESTDGTRYGKAQ